MMAFYILLFLLHSAVLSAAVRSQSVRASGAPDPKLVVAHFIVGNTYPYTVQNWAADIALAYSKGIDAFALDVGVDYWQPARVADAYAAAKNSSSKFKLFLSFDMTSLPCSSSSDMSLLQQYIANYSKHPNQLMYSGKPVVSTFSGENCRFGADNLQDAWTNAVKSSKNPAVYFLPAFFVNASIFPSLPVMDGILNWNSAWPAGDFDVNFQSDQTYISNLSNRTYVAGISPWFFTHYGPNSYNKNFIYRADDWLLAERWELLIENRNKVAIAELITWNDYGESHYVGPIEGAQPNSQAWTTGFDHQGWLDLIQYYAVAYKNGTYPVITRDRLFLWARLYPAAAQANDPVAKPQNWQWTQDYVWAVSFLVTPAKATLSCGSSTYTATLPSGISKFKLPLTAACKVNASLSRNGTTVLKFAPAGFNFSTNPPSYNFNAFVAASP